MKKIYLLLALVIFMSSCEKEEVFEIQNESSIMHFSTVPQKDAINFLKNLKKSNSNKQSEIVIHYDQLHYDTINNSKELLTVIPAQSKFAEVDSRVLVLEVDGNIEPVLFNLVPEIQNNDTLFTGKIIISNLDLKFITGFRVKNGNLITQFVKKDNPDKSTKCQDGYWEGIDMDCYQNLDEVVLMGSSSTPYISISHIYPNSGGGFDDGSSWAYPSHGGSGGGSPTPTEPEPEPVVINVNIDDSIYEYPCLAKVLENVLNSDSALFMKTIASFINNPKYDLTFTVGECSRTDNTCTDGSNVDTTGEIFIKIEDTNQNPINFATAILHEAIHAEIFRFVNEHHEGFVDPNNMPQLFEYFQHYAGTKWAENIDHIYMTQFYITPIAAALRKLDNFQYPLNYYKTFAWDGLRKWDPNNSLGITDQEYSQYRNEVTLNFKINCDDE